MGRTALTTTSTAERSYISKSKFLWGSQCHKLLWHAYNAKDQIPGADATTQAINVMATNATVLGDAGTILVYNAAFEKGVLPRCADLLPDFGQWVTSVKLRLVDLHLPFKRLDLDPQPVSSTSFLLKRKPLI